MSDFLFCTTNIICYLLIMTEQTRSSDTHTFDLSSLIAAVPYMLTFRPEGSVVILWFDNEDKLVVTQRADLPTDFRQEQVQQWREQALKHEVAEQGNRALFVFVPDASTSHVDKIAHECVQGLPSSQVIARVVTDFTSYRYVGNGVCHAITAADELKAANLFSSGMSERPMSSRTDVEAEIAPRETISSRYMAYARRRYQQSAEEDSYSKWSEIVFSSAIQPLLSGTRLSNRQVADITVWLHQTHERDKFICLLASDDIQLSPHHLIDVVSRSPVGMRAPIATATAVYAYMHGDGLRANIALDIALADDREYHLAHLVVAAIKRSVAPADMRRMLAEESQVDYAVN
jgi:hypothetical protein